MSEDTSTHGALMTNDVRVRPCRYCGEPKPDDCWCASDACHERVEAAIADQSRWIAEMRGVFEPARKRGAA